MLKTRVIWACGIALLAVGLRFPQLETRPMHADEAILADKFGSLLETGKYSYDPNEYHGPLLALASLAPAYTAGRHTYVSLSENVLRVTPAAAGVALALTPFLLIGAVGEIAAIAAALLLAVSPVCVYYSRYYIPEMLLALLTALLLIAGWRTFTTNSIAAWACAGAAAAAALCTKETAVIALASAAIPFAILCRPRLTIRTVLALGAGAVLVILLLIDPILLLQSFPQYWSRGTTNVLHQHPPQYYLSLLLGFEGRFIEALPIALAVVALFLPAPAPFPRFLKWFALLMTVIYSAIPYKTPWCVVSLVFAYALLAGITVDSAFRRKPIVTSVLLLAGCAHLGWQAWQASFRYSADPRNQWAYAHTTPEVFTIRDQVGKYANASLQGKQIKIAVYTRENLWPLPWYFRAYPNIGWSRDLAISGPAAPIVIASPDMEPLLQRKFYEGPPPGERELYMNLFPEELYLRPGVPVRGYVVKSLWDGV